jgi:hypothetical protein
LKSKIKILKRKFLIPITFLLWTAFSVLQSTIGNADDLVISSPPTPGPIISSPTSAPASPCSITPCEAIFHPPAFKVVFHNPSGQTHVLVPKKTTNKQLENLIYYLAEERKISGFDKIGLPPNGSGDYLRGSILVFNEIKWAKGEKLTNPRIKEKTYSRKVLAEYIWNNHNETAYIGQRSLFSRSFPR